jgi:transposase
MARELTRKEKLSMVFKYYHEKKKHKTIARELHCTRQEVGHVLQLFVTTGDVEGERRSGRPRVVRDEVEEVVDKAIKRKRHATGQELADVVEETTGTRVSARTMRRVRRRLHYHPVHISVKPALTERHMEARLAWCQEHLHDNVRSFVFLDEMGVCLDHHRRLYWIKHGEARPVKETMPLKVRLNVWGAVWWEGKSDLHITRDNFNSEKYVEVLEATLSPHVPMGRRRFIQDGVPFHWTHAVTGWFSDHQVRLVEDFPAKSPDLNIVEYVWGWMKYHIAGDEPHDADSLEEAIESAWESLAQVTIQHFMEHMTTVMREIIAADGGHSH